MWRRRHDRAPGESRGGESSPGSGRRRGWLARFTPAGRSAWRMDPPGPPQVAGTASAAQDSKHGSANQGERAAPDVVSAPGPWPAEERLGHDMPSIYCTRCGQANPDDARFCLHCGTMLARAGGDRPGETTSIISLSGEGEAEYGEE